MFRSIGKRRQERCVGEHKIADFPLAPVGGMMRSIGGANVGSLGRVA